MTVTYSLFLKRTAEKELRSLSSKDLNKVLDKLRNLSVQPRPPGSEKMVGDDRYRIRQGDWRILYSVDDHDKTVMVFKLGHRREVYRSP